ncbi:unsaturated rhamnogalacturonyl hydrolase [Lewinella marina]|uniref:Glycosyl hydrolase family 88 n=1 Tax=Neolewinella marina TaxID=438751 RepID=A0A2G0CIR7_9BACT|nr:glycoside hydrolase family 88 protein [Neolewinella marina]NJB84991.1 unsaturated rhamnogalacturonyl hydrolase [Neolewinella marina]PHK99859.1 glycosyl hydrolase family 88 [Neolewinella marina]
MYPRSLTTFFGGLATATLLLTLAPACTAPETDATPSASEAMTVTITEDRPWSERMALSIMQRAPVAWQNDFQERPRWNYTLGLVLQSVAEVGDYYQDPALLAYARDYGDTMIYPTGEIRDYELTKFNIDHIAPGPLLMDLYAATGEEKYLTAMNTLMRQLEWQPRTTEGGYWHKLRYPWQMWLDGLFMGEPFQAEFASKFDHPEAFDHIAEQFVLAEEKMRDPATGLLYHGWDESRTQRWADPETGCSEHFWARAIGWYAMGLVDVLDFFPEDHPRRDELLAILNRTLEAVVTVRDPETKTWWQVINLPEREGNYLESTASTMFAYAMIKGVNEGYLDERYRQLAQESYDGILETFIRVDADGSVNLTDGCSVAGLGGDPYRDGTFEYYISEPVRDNDPKGIGPFMRASLEFEKAATTAKL